MRSDKNYFLFTYFPPPLLAVQAQVQSAKFGVLKQPYLEVKIYETGGNNPSVSLPLFMWLSFEYRMINNYAHFTGGGKSKYCVLQEFEGSQLQVGIKIEVLEKLDVSMLG